MWTWLARAEDTTSLLRERSQSGQQLILGTRAQQQTLQEEVNDAHTPDGTGEGRGAFQQGGTAWGHSEIECPCVRLRVSPNPL